MSATRDGKMWRCQFYYKDWQSVSHKKNKGGFKTKADVSIYAGSMQSLVYKDIQNFLAEIEKL